MAFGTAFEPPLSIVKRKPVSLAATDFFRVGRIACGKQKAQHTETFRYLDVDGIPYPPNYAKVRCSAPPSADGLSMVRVVRCDTERGIWECGHSHEWYIVEQGRQLSYLRRESSVEPGIAPLRAAMKATAHAPGVKRNLLDGQFCVVLEKAEFNHWGVECGRVDIDLLERCEGDECQYTVTSIVHSPIDGDLTGRFPPHAADWKAPRN
jgi:hypothetical protein